MVTPQAAHQLVHQPHLRDPELHHSKDSFEPHPLGDGVVVTENVFEGPEKLLEIWFHPSEASAARHHQRFNAVRDADRSENSSDAGGDGDVNGSPHGDRHCLNNPEHKQAIGLRCIPRHIWEDMLTLVRCQVLSTIHNEHIDAYLLSESSMFIHSNKLVLKTCGTTTLLAALPRILEIARDYCGFHRVWRLFYSRKSFMFPDLQMHPHKTWTDEVEFLDRLIDNGSAYVVGKVNGDHWNLYLSAPAKDILRNDLISEGAELDGIISDESDSDSEVFLTSTNGEHTHKQEDQTIEILMTNLCPDAMRAFHRHGNEPDGLADGRRVERDTHLDYVYHPSAQTDSFLFSPCGYSMNGLKDDKYFTVHVTPEPEFSYASYETTVPVKPVPGCDGAPDPARSLSRLVKQVVDVFRPGRFSVTVFDSTPHHVVPVASKVIGDVDGYLRTDRIHYEFDGYDMVFGHFEKC